MEAVPYKGRLGRGEQQVVRRSVNIVEVAVAAGVGVGTVSRVLNASPHVRPATRQRVLEVIDRLDYRPSRLATSLARGSSRSVAILAPHLTRPSVVFRIEGMLSVLEEHGFDALLCNVTSPEQLGRHLDAVADPHRADGVIIVSIRLDAHQVDSLRRAAVPVVSVDADTEGISCVLVDDVAAGRLATEHLLSLGHTRIAFVGDSQPQGISFVSSDRRLAGHRRALEAAGSDRCEDLVRLVPHGADEATGAILDLLGSPVPPTAVFAASDTQAMGVLRGAAKRGIKVPDGLSVIGFDDIEAARLLRISTVRQPMLESGRIGAAHLCRLIADPGAPSTREVLPVELVERHTTAPPRKHRSGGKADAA